MKNKAGYSNNNGYNCLKNLSSIEGNKFNISFLYLIK